ncbi:MAG: SCO1664 family protein [Actinomycetota bacterium]|nr:SCO1664 family protein [Actinomycetota bacterium]
MSGDERASRASGLTVPHALEAGDLEVLGALPDSSNAALLVRCEADDGSCIAVYKPMRGEAPLWDFPDGTLHRREVAAFELARALGWPLVPPTVLRDGPFGPGSVQLFITFDPAEHFFTMEVERADVFRRVAIFDIAVNNADRKGGHCLLGDDGEVWVIDHGVCFAVEPKLRTVIWTFVDEPLPADAVGDLERVRAAIEPDGDLAAALGELLAPDEVAATRARIDRLLAAGRFPEPEPGVRPFPWPPI